MEDSKLRNIIREVLKEELGKEMRYAVTMDFYVWGHSDEEAVANAKQIAKEMDSKMDNQPRLKSIDRQLHGTMGSTPVEFNQFDEGALKKIKQKLSGVSDEQLAYNKKHGLPDNWKGSKEGFYEKHGEGNSSPSGSNE
jgi:hypothetical protein